MKLPARMARISERIVIPRNHILNGLNQQDCKFLKSINTNVDFKESFKINIF
jgi:hypothetical protein